MSSSPDYIVAVDVETSGTKLPGSEKPGQKPSQAIEIAVCIVDSRTLQIVDSFESRIRFDATQFSWDGGAQKVHGISRDELTDAPTRAEVGEQVWQLIRKWLPNANRGILFLAHNPNFDKTFTIDLVAAAGHNLKFLTRTLDAFSYGFATFGLHNSDHQFRFLGAYRDKNNHRAIDDIKLSIEMLRRVRQAGNAYLTLLRHGKWLFWLGITAILAVLLLF